MMKISSNFCRAIRSQRRCRGRAVRLNRMARLRSSSYSSSRIGTQTEVASHLLLCSGRVLSPVPPKHRRGTPRGELGVPSITM
jgi:hypothetical protein